MLLAGFHLSTHELRLEEITIDDDNVRLVDEVCAAKSGDEVLIDQDREVLDRSEHVASISLFLVDLEGDAVEVASGDLFR